MLYEYRCPECNQSTEEFRRVDDREPSNCEKCGVKMKRVYNPTPFTFDFKYGWDEGLGKYVDSKRERQQEMDRLGVRRIRD